MQPADRVPCFIVCVWQNDWWSRYMERKAEWEAEKEAEAEKIRKAESAKWRF